MSLVVKGAALPDGTRRDLHVRDGIFVDDAGSSARVIDADGLIALPGLVDLHTHLREPGFEQSETVLTGSRAAAAGGDGTGGAGPETTPALWSKCCRSANSTGTSPFGRLGP